MEINFKKSRNFCRDSMSEKKSRDAQVYCFHDNLMKAY